MQCTIGNAVPRKPREAPLPEFRVPIDGTRAFASVGMDIAGPFLLKAEGRGKAQPKVWVQIVTCAAIRAVHLEVLQSLDTSSVLMAMARFAARRGRPDKVVTDNATSYVAADKDLRAAVQHRFRRERFKKPIPQSRGSSKHRTRRTQGDSSSDWWAR